LEPISGAGPGFGYKLMRFLVFLASFGFALFFGTTSARAELRDISFSARAETAQILFSFGGQPSAVKVFITETGIDVDVLGIGVEAAEFVPNSNLFRSIRPIPAPGGARIRAKLSDHPLAASAEVFERSVLVTVTFAHPIEPAGGQVHQARATPVHAPTVHNTPAHAAPTHVKPAHIQDTHGTPKATDEHHVAAPVGHDDPHAMAESHPPAHQPSGHDISTHDSPVHEPEEDLEQPGHDGAPAKKHIPLPEPKVGHGMIRDASTKAAGSLSQEQCDASEAVVQEDPWALDNLARFGSCLAREGKTKDAREVFERLLTFDPETFAAYVGLGAIAQDAGNAEQARQYYEEALALGGTDREAAQARELLQSLEGH
jgi:hypothetical protein